VSQGFPITRRAALAAGIAAGVAGAASAAPARAQAYRSIRYARAERFGPATVVPFTESLIQAERGPVSPQRPSRLAVSMGPQSPNRQDEHCQVLSVFTPSRSGSRPVLVFLHGGAFISGGGEVAWYDGDRMAAEQDIVVVPVTYRLGALGFWLPPGSSGLSPGISDQVAALEWIQANIAKFGGDPANVTVAGQSAGAASVRGLVDWGYGQKLFRRIMPQSGGPMDDKRAEMEKVSRQFDTVIGMDPRRATVEQVLDAQTKVTQMVAVPGGSSSGWRPVGADAPARINVDVVTGWTREDPAGHMLLAQGKTAMPGLSLQPARDAVKVSSLRTIDYGRQVAAAGRKAYVYSFDWNGPDTGLGDCHCIELAFLFGDRAAWGQAPMLAGVDWNEYERMGRSMRAQWAGFARSGVPGPAWRPVTAAAAPVNSLA
jgi:para-nitrobenzyl esterase